MKPNYFVIACLISSVSFANGIGEQSAVIAVNNYLTNAAILASINPSYKEMVNQSDQLIIGVNISLLKPKKIS